MNCLPYILVFACIGIPLLITAEAAWQCWQANKLLKQLRNRK